MIGSATTNGRVSITGIGSKAPERVMTNDELAEMVDTSDEWIMERTGIRERRVAAPEEALSDLALPASLDALEHAGVEPSAVDLIVVATVTPDMMFPSTGAILADRLGAHDAAAYDLRRLHGLRVRDRAGARDGRERSRAQRPGRGR